MHQKQTNGQVFHRIGLILMKNKIKSLKLKGEGGKLKSDVAYSLQRAAHSFILASSLRMLNVDLF